MKLRARTLVAVTMALASIVGATGEAKAQSGNCVDLCGSSCIKPLSMPDRWDDVTGISGYVGGGRRPDWRNNRSWDHETFADSNGDGLHDDGEAFLDGNGSGLYDQELYDPAATGYSVAGNLLSFAGDVGLELILHMGFSGEGPVPGVYRTFAFPPINKGTPQLGGDPYREAMADCEPTLIEPGDWIQTQADGFAGPTNQWMSGLIAKDPDAIWDPSTLTVQNSLFPLSPRVVFLAIHDPRQPILPNSPGALRVVKVVAFFMEQMTGPAEVRGRLLRTAIPSGTSSSTCTAGEVGGFLVECPVPAAPTSWGHVKATYR